MLQRNSVRIIVTALYFCIAADLAVADANSGVYVSDAITAEYINAAYRKTVDNTHPKNTSTQKGRINRAESDTEGGINGFGHVFGYRMPLGSGRFFLSGEIELFFVHGGSVYGDIEENGASEAPNQLGESWAEYWTLSRDNNYGFTLKLGGNPGPLEALKANVYALAGIRFTSSRLDTYYNGCDKPEPCAVGEYNSWRGAKDFSAIGWTGGVGVEKKLFRRTWLEVEGRYSSYGAAKWVNSFPDAGIEITSELANQTATFRLNVVIR